MKEFPNIEIKDDLESYSDQDLQFIARELHIEAYEKLDRKGLIDSINKTQTKSTVNDILRRIDFDITSSSGMTSILIDFWFVAFRKSKWVTSITTIAFFVTLGLSINYYDNKEAKILKKERKESLELNNRIKELEDVEASLKNLIVFIESQKKAIVQTEQSLNDLEKKKNELEPIVATQKETVEAIFREQDNRNWENRWLERLIGFGLGIAASIIASIIYGIIKRLTATNKT